MNVKAEFIGDRADIESKFEYAEKHAGAFWYGDSDDFDRLTILHSCPCGCGMLGSLPLVKQEERPFWTNSGTREVPTLSPSVGIHPVDNPEKPERGVGRDCGYHWHGWLRDGVWVSV